MNWAELIPIFIGSGGLLGIILLFFRMGKFAQKIESLEKMCNKNFTEIHTDIKEMKQSITSIQVQMGKLETRVEERTLRTVHPDYERNRAVR